jgi:hypothetical protein
MTRKELMNLLDLMEYGRMYLAIAFMSQEHGRDNWIVPAAYSLAI